MTAGVTIGLTIYAFTTKKDFTYCGSFLVTLVCALFLMSILTFIIDVPWLNRIYSLCGIIVYSFYLIYDT